MIRTCIQFLSLTLVLLSSYFLIKGSLILTIEEIAKSSGTYLGYNENVMRSLSSQKANNIVGSGLLLCSFFLQAANLLWPMRFKDFAVDKDGVILAIALSLIFYILSSRTALKLSNYYFNKSDQFMNEKILRKEDK